MEQSSASAPEVRFGKDQKGLGQNRQGKAYRGQAKGGAQARPNNAGKQAKPLETQAERPSGEKAVSWEMRCSDLGHGQWQRFSGPFDAWKTARLWASLLDHDEAYPIAWGKTVTVEMRRIGRDNVLKFEVSGEPIYRYHAKAIG